jgi:hypothetical protein
MAEGSTYGSIVEVQVWTGERDTTQKEMRMSCTRQRGQWRKYEREICKMEMETEKVTRFWGLARKVL